MSDTAAPSHRLRAVRLWLITVAVLIAAMVLVGGATRLTESGLSIVEWKPVSGTLPPLTQQAWTDAVGFLNTRTNNHPTLINLPPHDHGAADLGAILQVQAPAQAPARGNAQ